MEGQDSMAEDPDYFVLDLSVKNKRFSCFEADNLYKSLTAIDTQVVQRGKKI